MLGGFGILWSKSETCWNSLLRLTAGSPGTVLFSFTRSSEFSWRIYKSALINKSSLQALTGRNLLRGTLRAIARGND